MKVLLTSRDPGNIILGNLTLAAYHCNLFCTFPGSGFTQSFAKTSFEGQFVEKSMLKERKEQTKIELFYIDNIIINNIHQLWF